MTGIDVDHIRANYAAPYYLSMPTLEGSGIREFIDIARAASTDEVLWMLATKEWRCRKAGAWFTLVRPDAEIVAALQRSLLSASDQLTAPDLGVALAQHLGGSALPLLLEHQAESLLIDPWSQGMMAALISSLGGTPLSAEASATDEARITAMRATAATISRLAA